MTHTDELAMPHFEEQLWAEIRSHHEDGRWARPAPALDRVPAAVTGRPTIHRRAARRSLAAAAALAVIAAAGALSSIGGNGGDGDGTGRGTEPEASEAPAASDIETRTIAAIDQALADSVVHTTHDFLDNADVGDGESWYDEATGAERHVTRTTDGVLYDLGPAVAPTLDGEPEATATIRTVDHCFSEYDERESAGQPAESEAEMIRDRLAAGTLVAGGTEVVDGRELIRLIEPTPEAPADDAARRQRMAGREQPATPPPVDLVYYVDPDSYRPVLSRLYPGESAQLTTTYEYIPRTAGSLADLVPAIPDGFTQVPQIRDKDELYAAGCG
jgi:hypothetical protein